MSDIESESKIIGTCTDCGGAIFNVEPFERVGVEKRGREAFATKGLFRCAPCSLSKKGLKITIKDPNGKLPEPLNLPPVLL